MSDTPKTDKLTHRDFEPGTYEPLVDAEFARDIERELTEVTEQRDKMAEALRFATAYPLTESWYKQAIKALATLKPCD
jgi:hypothetical protein